MQILAWLGPFGNEKESPTRVSTRGWKFRRARGSRLQIAEF
jgi:hypothetical protein